ncbi:uncharacterized protein LOC123506332 isoform X3 [Portunus trituberculatus]|uniref:uncharacterized protein LOC123506332 isoform X3 n=1 Tax=Portunus trituberculatus TaxID=210409 RepID=UPI001E1D0FB7|nr:uncharacterized protein LOC123506332 isoform X3 [Portunus trituberculatus]
MGVHSHILQDHSFGCAISSKWNGDKPQLAYFTPLSVVREMEYNIDKYPENTSRYFAFTDGSVYTYPPVPKNNNSTCENYDPHTRYFYTQSKSPEPRDVVVLVHSGQNVKQLLRDIVIGTIDGLSLMDRVGLCLPATDGCQIGPFGAEKTATGSSWPGPDIPLSKQSFLGQMLSTNNKNKNELGKHLDLWLKDNNSTPFSNHSAAVDAGLHFLNSSSNHPFSLLAEDVRHKVLVYVTTEEAWEEDPSGNENLKEAYLNGIFVVVYLIEEREKTVVQGETTIVQEEETTLEGEVEARNVQDRETEERQNIGYLEVVHFPVGSSFVDAKNRLPSFGQNNQNQPVITIPYWDAFGMGYIITVCMPLVFKEEFVGSTCDDVYVVNLLADLTIHDIENAYVFVINSLGITLMHPLLPSPHSVTQDPATVTIDKLEQHMDSYSILKKIIREETGKEDREKGVLVEALGWPADSHLPNAVRGKSANLRFLWGPINQTDLTLVLVLPLINGKVLSTRYTCLNGTPCKVKNFHYHKPQPGDTSISFCKYLGTQVVYDKGLVKLAPDCFNDMLGYLRREDNESISQIYSIFNGSHFFNKLLRTDLKPSVKLAEKAVDVWKDLHVSGYIAAQYMGTSDGVFISLPGTEFKSSYDHRSRPWYQLTISSLNGDHLSMTTPRCIRYKSTMVYTLARSLRSHQGTPLAVVAGDFTFQYIMGLFLEQVPDCKQYMCLLVDQMGYVVFTTEWSSNMDFKCDNKSGITAAHITKLVPDIARDMIASRLLRRRGCHDYERDITFYYWWLNMRGHRTLHKGDTYEVHKIPSSNLYFVIQKQGQGQGNCHCISEQEEILQDCHSTCKMECECPCKGGPLTQPCHSAPHTDIHSSRWPLPACKPSDPSHPFVSDIMQTEQELEYCYNCDGQKEKSCKEAAPCEWRDNQCMNI